MPTYSLTLRGDLNRRLSISELDENFQYLQQLAQSGTGGGGTGSVGPQGPAGATGPQGIQGPTGAAGGGSASLPDEFTHTNSTTNFQLLNISEKVFLGATNAIIGEYYENNGIIWANGISFSPQYGITYSSIGVIKNNGDIFQFNTFNEGLSAGYSNPVTRIDTKLQSTTESIAIAYEDGNNNITNEFKIEREKVEISMASQSKFIIGDEGALIGDTNGLVWSGSNGTFVSFKDGIKLMNGTFSVINIGTYSGAVSLYQSGSYSIFNGVTEYKGQTGVGSAWFGPKLISSMNIRSKGLVLNAVNSNNIVGSTINVYTSSTTLLYNSSGYTTTFIMDSDFTYNLGPGGLSPSYPSSYIINENGSGNNLLRLSNEGTFSQTNPNSDFLLVNNLINLPSDSGSVTYSFAGSYWVDGAAKAASGVFKIPGPDINFSALLYSGTFSISQIVAADGQVVINTGEWSSINMSTASMRIAHGDGATHANIRMENGAMDINMTGTFSISDTYGSEPLFQMSEDGGIIANYLISAGMGGTAGFADDAAAAVGGVPIGGLYHREGEFKIRVI